MKRTKAYHNTTKWEKEIEEIRRIDYEILSRATPTRRRLIIRARDENIREWEYSLALKVR